MPRRKVFLKILAALALAPLLVFVYLMASVYLYSRQTTEAQADAAVVLGAAVWTKAPSPVFRERINHAVNLYKSGRVRKLIFTGARGSEDEPAESAAARTYALRQGVRDADILVETRSHTTFENLYYARRIASQQGLRKILVVTDPLHMRRAVSMAQDLGLDAYPSPTPTSKYRTFRSRFGLLLQETSYYLGYLVVRPFDAA